MYNPRPQYAQQLESLMRKIDTALPVTSFDDLL